ncbi:BlaI/MecI/CopY family transcriptional regulator [Paludisphaera borealis]|uniref:Penicillinase repressor n=1 Tax=Paludisphaera borealis TaxID=1387353 RepID=A0A1U7CY16_9BACT|nr:BlaI/MecI/CopY family transcriptional regulator [Paludisphaera borealis]APW63796.1 Penicillinase repressor [Paludisphaera borealis]
MAGRKVLALTERQFAVLRVLWEHGPQTVRGLMEHMPRGDGQPYTTVLGLLQSMEKAGLVDHEKQGLTHLYRSAVSRREATGNLLSDFLTRFFHGSAEQLILGLVDADQLAPDDLRAIEARLGGEGETRPESEKAEKTDKRRRNKP